MGTGIAKIMKILSCQFDSWMVKLQGGRLMYEQRSKAIDG